MYPFMVVSYAVMIHFGNWRGRFFFPSQYLFWMCKLRFFSTPFCLFVFWYFLDKQKRRVCVCFLNHGTTNKATTVLLNDTWDPPVWRHVTHPQHARNLMVSLQFLRFLLSRWPDTVCQPPRGTTTTTAATARRWQTPCWHSRCWSPQATGRHTHTCS